MKLALYSQGGAAPRLGLVKGDEIAPLADASGPLAPDMIALIKGWDALEARARAAEAAFADAQPLSAVTLHAPIPRPGKIMAIGLNYADHVAESGQPAPTQQIWFTKAVTAVNGPADPIQIPRVSMAVDWEAELVAVIGKGGRHVGAEAVFGYCCGNDVTVRDWQFRTPQWSLGKSFDTHAPIGPWIVTADEIDPKAGLGIRALVNGETRQDSNTRHLIFDVAAQVAQLSDAMTLEPGDLIFTGTPGGVGAAMKPPQFLKAGDVVRIEIDGIGHIEAACEPEV